MSRLKSTHKPASTNAARRAAEFIALRRKERAAERAAERRGEAERKAK